MSWLDRLEKWVRPFAVPGVTLYLIVGQTIVYVLALSKPEIRDAIALVPAHVFEGQLWRMFTFVLYPPIENALFAFFAWYLFYLMGDALESKWGVARYNIFLLIAYIATLLASLLSSVTNPGMVSTNAYIGGSVFLAFAYLFPDFQIFLFFILPIKVKWLALITWIGYFIRFAVGPTWTDRLLVVAAVSNFLLFFGRDILMTMRASRLKMKRQAEGITPEDQSRHRCVECGVTEKDDPAMDFRYCSRCADSPCYCGDHIRNHQHRLTPAPPPSDQ